jgi:hypothetical protein
MTQEGDWYLDEIVGEVSSLKEENKALRARMAELEGMLSETLAVLEIYYQPNSDGSTPTISKARAILAKDRTR